MNVTQVDKLARVSFKTWIRISERCLMSVSFTTSLSFRYQVHLDSPVCMFPRFAIFPRYVDLCSLHWCCSRSICCWWSYIIHLSRLLCCGVNFPQLNTWSCCQQRFTGVERLLLEKDCNRGDLVEFDAFCKCHSKVLRYSASWTNGGSPLAPLAASTSPKTTPPCSEILFDNKWFTNIDYLIIPRIFRCFSCVVHYQSLVCVLLLM